MERTKKLFGYIVALVAILSLFFGSMTMQTIASFAADGFRPSIEQKGTPEVVEGQSYMVPVVDEDGKAVIDAETGEPVMEEVDVDKELKLVSIGQVAGAKEESEMTEAEKKAEQDALDQMTPEKQAEYREDKQILAQAKKEVVQLVESFKSGNDEEVKEVFGEEVLEAMDEAAKAVSVANGSEYEYDRDVMSVTDIVKAELGSKLERLIKTSKKPVKVTFGVHADVVLFKSKASNTWRSLKIVLPSNASNAAPLNAAGSETTTVEMDEAEGILVFQEVREDADTIMKAKADKKAEEEKDKDKGEKDEACCSDCKNCPFCSFLCKDGKCYCWTMYLAIALAVVLLILVIALAIVKAKDKKVSDIQVPEEEEEPISRQPKNPDEEEEEQQNAQQQNRNDSNNR